MVAEDDVATVEVLGLESRVAVIGMDGVPTKAPDDQVAHSTAGDIVVAAARLVERFNSGRERAAERCIVSEIDPAVVAEDDVVAGISRAVAEWRVELADG